MTKRPQTPNALVVRAAEIEMQTRASSKSLVSTFLHSSDLKIVDEDEDRSFFDLLMAAA